MSDCAMPRVVEYSAIAPGLTEEPYREPQGGPTHFTSGLACLADGLSPILSIPVLPAAEASADAASYRLLVGDNPESAYADWLLGQVGVSFQAVQESGGVYPSNGQFWHLPVLQSTEDDDGLWPSLKHVKNFCRYHLLPLPRQEEGSFYSLDGRWREYLERSWTWGEHLVNGVMCIDEHGHEIYHSPIAYAPYPVEQLLMMLPYAQKQSGAHDVYQELVVWRIGSLADILTRLNSFGAFVSANPAAVLFPDEINLLKHGTVALVVDSVDAWADYICVEDDVYINLEGTVYRLWGSYVD